MAADPTTQRINRHQLVRLLDTMTPHEWQAITQRTLISEVDGAVAPMPSGRRYPRPSSHVAAMLPAVLVRPPRPTLVRRVAGASLEKAVVELSAQVMAQLTPEEIAMLPPQFRPGTVNAAEVDAA